MHTGGITHPDPKFSNEVVKYSFLVMMSFREAGDDVCKHAHVLINVGLIVLG